MDYLFGGSGGEYDVEGVQVEECTVQVLPEKRPYVYGPTPFTVRCSVRREGKRDLSPPSVDRSPAEFVELARCLAVSFPGSIVPPVQLETLSTNQETSGARAANRFLRRLADHAELGRSRTVLEFLLRGPLPKAMYSAELEGSEFAFAAATARLTGSVAPEDDEIAQVLAWAKEKEKLLDVASQKARKASASCAAAARDASSLLAAGGVLLEAVFSDTETSSAKKSEAEAFDEEEDDSEEVLKNAPSLRSDPFGLDAALVAFADEKAKVNALRTAASHARSLADRLAAARQSLEAHEASFGKREKVMDPLSAAGSLTLATASDKKDVERAKAKKQRLTDVAETARRRFAAEARSFIQDFPHRFSAVVDALVTTQVASARLYAATLTAAHQATPSFEETGGDSDLDRNLADVADPPWSTSEDADDSARRPDDARLPAWAKGEFKGESSSDATERAGEKPATFLRKNMDKHQPAWVDEGNDAMQSAWDDT
mmetsp:Transcript_7321/g.22543  ORF Transcript_7321/g.22543 Transcript_7321/m.22543 type:complete len:488 (+) Transcript_7321:74-1537(+)